MIAALADAGAALGRQDYIDAASACARFVRESMRDADGRLLRTWKGGEARLNAYLEDHAYLVEALLRLYEATLEVRWFDAARETADAMIARFADHELGGFFTTSDDHEELIARRKDVGDHPIPSGNSSATYGLLRLAALTGESSYEEWALGTMRVFAPAALQHPEAFGHLLQAIDFHLSPTREVALVGPANGAGSPAGLDELARVVRSAHRPHVVLAGGEEGTERPELLRERPRGRGPSGGLRLRALRLQGAGDRAGGAGGGAHPGVNQRARLLAPKSRFSATMARWKAPGRSRWASGLRESRRRRGPPGRLRTRRSRSRGPRIRPVPLRPAVPRAPRPRRPARLPPRTHRPSGPPPSPRPPRRTRPGSGS